MNKLLNKIKKSKHFLSWQGMLTRAFVIGVVFLIAHLLNGREYAGGMFGTYNIQGYQKILGVIYALFYFLSIVVVPIYLISSLFIWFLERFKIIKNIDHLNSSENEKIT